MRPSQVIAWQRRELADLEAYCEVLKGALASHGVETIPQRGEWARDLTPQQRTVVGALFNVYPRRLSAWSLLEIMPGRDWAQDRSSKQVGVLVFNIRKKLGQDAILNDWGVGYWLGPELYASMRTGAAEDVAAAA